MIGTSGWGQRIGAAIVTLLTGIFGFLMAQPAFETTPPLSEAGSILVGVERGTAATPVRVDVHMTLRPSEETGKFELALLGDPDSPVAPDEAGDLILGFCGAMKDVLLRKANDSADLKLQPLIGATGPDLFSSAVGQDVSLKNDCQALTIRKNELTGIFVGTAGESWAVFFEGEIRVPTAAVAGAQHRFVFPNITSIFLPSDWFPMDAVARTSMATLTPKDLPSEFIPSVTSPAMPDSGILEWKFPVIPDQRTESYRITGTDQREQAWAQGQLFIASGLFGVAGGGLIWFFGTFFSTSERELRNLVSSVAVPKAPSSGRTGAKSLRRRTLAATFATVLAGAILAFRLSRRRSDRRS